MWFWWISLISNLTEHRTVAEIVLSVSLKVFPGGFYLYEKRESFIKQDKIDLHHIENDRHWVNKHILLI